VKTWLTASALLLLVGCTTVPKEVRIRVPVPCVEQAPQRPSLIADAELRALDDYGLVIALARDRRLRQGYEAQLEAVLAGCL
jgi:hypothetical protein